MPAAPKTSSMSIGRLRALILFALIAGLSTFTGVMFKLVQSLSERFGPQVQADLEWRAERGAQELANAGDLGLAVGDEKMVADSFGAYATSKDVSAIIAVDATNKVVAQHGSFASIDEAFAAKPRTLIAGADYIASWAPATIEGNTVGKVAIIVSTGRMIDATKSLDDVKEATLIAGVVGLVVGCLIILFFTHAVSVRDHKLGDYAANLEKKVDDRTRELDERNRGMRLVLDNVAQGFITIDPNGVMAAERSAIVRTWFGDIEPGSTFSAMVAAQAPELGIWLDLGLEDIRSGIMPLEVCLDQLPKRFVAGGRTFDVGYSPILVRDQVESILLIVSDVTAAIERERTEREQREIVEVFQRITSDRVGFDEFLVEARVLVDSLRTPGDLVIEKRVIHTLKGNCGVYGLHSFAALCHDIESQLDESSELTEALRRGLLDGWRAITDRLGRLLGDRKDAGVQIDRAELATLAARVRDGLSSREVADTLASWTLEPVTVRLERLGRQAIGLGRRLGKNIDVEICDHKIRLDSERWGRFWGAMIHAIRNAVDHGIEDGATRETAGKRPGGKIVLGAVREHGRIVFTLSDDGRGIDWDAVRAKAERRGLAAGEHNDLTLALFSDGVSTRAEATDLSGRGVGLGVLRAAVEDLGGMIEVRSEQGRGTSFLFSFPDAPVIELRSPTEPIRRLG